MYPSSAISPRSSEYAGSAAMLRLMTSRLLLASTPVSECGYKNSANADPNAHVTYCSCDWLGSRKLPFFVASNFACAAPKTLSQPPSSWGIHSTATMITM